MTDVVIGSLCSGYGGLDLAVERALGARTAWFVEYDKDPSRILAHHWPDVPNHGDVKLTDWSTVEPVDILTAGYPCQPFSHAGKRKGADDPRHLWPDVARAISVLRPHLVVLENVRGHVSLGLDAVLGDLAALGYDAAWGVVRASDAGAPHSRARIFIVATPVDAGHGARGSEHGVEPQESPERPRQPDQGATPDPGRGQLEGSTVGGDGLRVAAERGAGAAADSDGVRVERRDHGGARGGARGGEGPGEPRGDGAAPADSARVGRGEGWTGAARRGGGPATVVGGPLDADARGDGRGGVGVSAGVDVPGSVADRRDGAGRRGRDTELLPTPTPFQLTNRESPAEWITRRADVVRRTGTHHGLPLPVAAESITDGHPILLSDPTAWDPTAPPAPDPFGPYQGAVDRWARIVGRDAPAATEATGRDGRPRLNPAFVEWMMGLDDGHVTATPDLSRNAQLKALGNGVVPQQALLALRVLLPILTEG